MAPGHVRITREVTQSVRDQIDIVDIASDLTRLQQRGKRYIGLCPFHKEKSPSFSVDPDAGLYYCFGCGAGGDAIGLFMQSSGDDFLTAIESLARRYGIALPEGPASSVPRERERDLNRALETAAAHFARELRASEFARSYLAKRGFKKEHIEAYALGYARDDWRHLLRSLEGRVPIADLIAAGLVGKSAKSGELYDRFRHRLMFPIHAPSGRLVGFGGRTLGDDKAKYINTAETAEFHKGRLLYGFHLAKKALRTGSRGLLVEGYFDVLGAAASGIDYAVAGMGTALTPEQAALLARYVDEVVLAYDGDAAGEKAFRRSLPILLEAGLHVRRAVFPEGHDPDSLRAEAGAQAVVEIVESAPDGIWLELDRLTPPPGQRSQAELARAAQAMLEIIKPIRNEMTRRSYTQRAAERLGVPEGVFLRKLGPQLFAGKPREEKKGEVMNHEERALQLLLQGAAASLPRPLPSKEIFFDQDYRNIYAEFYALYNEGGESPPSIEEMLARIREKRGPIDRIARLLLKESTSGGTDLSAILSQLERRWDKQRESELVRQIRQAQEQGDDSLLAELLKEKKEIMSRSVHPGMTGRWW